MALGFVIVRCVKKKEHDQYWKEAYTCIRKNYDHPILIVDDASDPQFVSTDFETVNCHIVASEYPARGEILGYYYFHRLMQLGSDFPIQFDRAIVIHDSVFIQHKIDFESIPQCGFLWSFAHGWDVNITSEIDRLFDQLDRTEELRTMYDNKILWTGCFGVMSVLTWDFIDRVNTRYKLFSSMLPIIKNRDDRMAFERVFACVCSHLDPTIRDYTIFGDIHQYCRWGRSFQNYKRGENGHLPANKIWTGR